MSQDIILKREIKTESWLMKSRWQIAVQKLTACCNSFKIIRMRVLLSAPSIYLGTKLDVVSLLIGY